MHITERFFGTFEGKPVMEYTLQNANGMQVSVINYGATVTKIITADRENCFANVITHYDNLEGYLQKSNPYYGCIVGRYCNRIAHGKFTLNGKEYQLAKNHGAHHLHGGVKGFDKVWWDVCMNETGSSITLSYTSKDGEECYPGNVTVTVEYALSENNEWSIHYTATTDQPTPVNLTNHCYFNLTGNCTKPILQHELKLFADRYTVTDKDLIPTGDIASVKNTGLDFTTAKPVGLDLHKTGGYDHNMILIKGAYTLSPAATVYDPSSGRFMEMFTTEPAVQFYSGTQDAGAQYGLCLEAQHYPDSPNHASFPDTILVPGKTYIQKTMYRFTSR